MVYLVRKKKKRRRRAAVVASVALLSFAARPPLTALCLIDPPALLVGAAQVRMPEAPGERAFETREFCVDCSNAADGYITVSCKNADMGAAKLVITAPAGAMYVFNLNYAGGFEAFPLSEGAGVYGVGVFVAAGGEGYRPALYCRVEVEADGAEAFLYPNAMVNFDSSGYAVKTAARLTRGCRSDAEKLRVLCEWVQSNIAYDSALALTVASGYLSDVERTLATRRGICADYATLLTAMLRGCGIPARLEFGYSQGEYHAWSSAYVDGAWVRLDPTRGGAADSADYEVKYIY